MYISGFAISECSLTVHEQFMNSSRTLTNVHEQFTNKGCNLLKRFILLSGHFEDVYVHSGYLQTNPNGCFWRDLNIWNVTIRV